MYYTFFTVLFVFSVFYNNLFGQSVQEKYLELKDRSERELQKFNYVEARNGYINCLTLVAHPSQEECELWWAITQTYDNDNVKETPIIRKYLSSIASSKKCPPKLQIDALTEIGNIYRKESQLDSSYYYLKNACKLAEKIEYGLPFLKIMYLYQKQGDYTKSMENGMKGFKLAEENKDTVNLVLAYNNLGEVFYHQRDFKKAVSYFETSIKIQKEKKLNICLERTYEVLGNYTINEKNDANKAISYYLLSLKAAQSSNYRKGIGYAYLQLSNAYSELSNDSKTFEYLNLAEQIFRQNNYQQDIAGVLLYRGYAHSDRKQYKLAISNLLAATQIYKIAGNKRNQAICMQELTHCYQEIGNYKEAFYYFEQYKTIDEEITGEQVKKDIENLNIQYQTEKKDRQLLANQLQLAQQKERMQNYGLIAILLAVLLILLIFYSRYRLQKQTKILLNTLVSQIKQVREKVSKPQEWESIQNQLSEISSQPIPQQYRAVAAVLVEIQQLEHEFINIVDNIQSFSKAVSHDLRLPIVKTKHYIQQAEQTNDYSYLKKAKHSLNDMEQIINSLLSLAQIEKNSLTYTEIDVESLLNDIWVNLSKPPYFQFTLKNIMPIQADILLLRQAFINILSNSIKFSTNNKQAAVMVSMYSKQNEYIIQINDNGIGIPPENITLLFKPFVRLTAAYEGVGLGLLIVEKIIKKHHGRVWIESMPTVGTSFYIALPNL